MMILMSIQYLAPNLAIHLNNYGYTESQIGLAYGIPAILYACTCPFMYLLTQRMRKRGIILIGFILITFAMAMIGGSDQLFEFQKQPVFVFLGLCIIGLSSGMITIPVLPEMLEAVEEDPEIANQYSMDTIQNLISGLFVSFQSIGEAIGPILSSFLTEHYGFTTS
jgi:MFS family permease